MPDKKIVCVIPEFMRASWAALPPGLDVRWCGDSGDDIAAALGDDAQVLVTDPMPTPGVGGGNLRWVQLLSGGTDQLLGHPLMEREGLRASNAAGVCAVHIAEFVLAQLLSHVRSLPLFARYQAQAHWPNRSAHAAGTLRGKRVIVVGYGGVGREVARTLHALGARVTAATRDGGRTPYRGYLYAPGTGDPDGGIPERFIASHQLAAHAGEADALVLTVSLGPQTRGLVNAQVLARMKPTAVLVNVARGAVVDTAALVEALDAGRLAHAYLDVFEREPLPPDSPLWRHPKVTATPHMSGVMADADAALLDLFTTNVRRFQAGQPLLNELDPRKFRAAQPARAESARQHL